MSEQNIGQCLISLDVMRLSHGYNRNEGHFQW